MQDSTLMSCFIETGKCRVLHCDIKHSPREPCYAMRLHLDRDIISVWLEEKFVFWAWTKFGPSGVCNLPCGTPTHSMPGAGLQGAGEKQAGTLGSEPAPFLAETIKGQIQVKKFSPILDLPPQVWTETESTGHVDMQHIARRRLKNYDGDEPGNSTIQIWSKGEWRGGLEMSFREKQVWQSRAILGGVEDGTAEPHGLFKRLRMKGAGHGTASNSITKRWPGLTSWKLITAGSHPVCPQGRWWIVPWALRKKFP